MAQHSIFDLAYDVAHGLFHASHNLAVEFAEWVTLADLPYEKGAAAIEELADDFTAFCAQPC